MFHLFRRAPSSTLIKALEDAITKQEFELAKDLINQALPNKTYSVDRKLFLRFMKITQPVGVHFMGESYTALIGPILAQPDDPISLYQLGYSLIEFGAPRVAVFVLHRLHHFRPDDHRVISELATALEGIQASEEVVALIRDALARGIKDLDCRIQLTYHELLCGDWIGARARYQQLLQETHDDPAQLASVTHLSGEFARIEAVQPLTGLDLNDLFGWHFVKMASFLTLTNPEQVSRLKGVFGSLQDTPALCRASIECCALLLRSWEVEIPTIFYTRDRGSRIFAQALARILHKPCEPLLQAHGWGLVVCYNLENLEGDDGQRLEHHLFGRPLFVHALHFLEHAVTCPDILGLYYLELLAPWERTEEDQFERISPSMDEAYIQEIIDAPIATHHQARRVDVEVLGPALAHQASFFREGHARHAFVLGGPVKIQTELDRT